MKQVLTPNRMIINVQHVPLKNNKKTHEINS